jgi:hypothetical protein
MSVTGQSTFQFFWRNPVVDASFRSGVSLHSHTMHSRESLDMIPRYTAKVPYLGNAIRRQEAKYSRKMGTKLDFTQAFWIPPFTPRQAYRLEEKQIQRRLQLPALVSLTDHDDIRAGSLLRVLDRFSHVPVSVEWTIPFASTFFHLGVHNLSPSEAPAIAERLADYTRNPDDRRLGSLLDVLNSDPDVLLVLNHPLWDEKGIGISDHSTCLRTLLEAHRSRIHGLELNGLRSWRENKAVIEIGQQTGLPLVSGGDRHAREPNAILNLSRATSFASFVHEIRYERVSHVVFMPQYHEPIRLRILQTMVDVVREYPENLPGFRSWRDRVFFREPEKPNPVPLSSIWNADCPGVVNHFITAMRLLEWRGVRSALRIALNDRAKMWNAPGFRTVDWDREAVV